MLIIFFYRLIDKCLYINLFIDAEYNHNHKTCVFGEKINDSKKRNIEVTGIC